MMTKDEAVRARIAALKLERLYNAYRATSRANAMVLTRISAELIDTEQDPGKRLQKLQRINQEMAVSRESDAVFRARAEQLQRRIAELDNYQL
ncbi:MAG: hypothetical protein AAF704_16510 [Cyanobacteria bacterium P01_D01_bin.123]